MATRHGNLFERIFSMDNLFTAYKKARKGKSQKRNVQAFETNVEGNLSAIQDLLINKRFRTSHYQIKTVHEPKRREIYVLPFAPDRIVQHALMNIVGPLWESMFIGDSYACRIGKGLHAGSRRTMEFVRRYAYCLKADVSKFYQSVDHEVLFEILNRKIKCKDTLWLLREIVYSLPGGKNIPIGNYTSQWLGNLYLNELDQMLKHEYKIRAYVRYCDDFCLFHDDKVFLRKMASIIREFLCDRLKLELSICDIFPVKRGVDFLGYRHFPDYILLRKSTATRMKRRLRSLPGLFEAGRITRDQLRSSVASCSGWLQWGNTHNLALASKLSEIQELADAA